MPRVPLDNFSNRWSMEILFCIWVMFHRSNKLIHVYQVSDFHHSQTYTTKLIMSVDQSVSMIVGQLLKKQLMDFFWGSNSDRTKFFRRILVLRKSPRFSLFGFCQKINSSVFLFHPKMVHNSLLRDSPKSAYLEKIIQPIRLQ